MDNTGRNTIVKIGIVVNDFLAENFPEIMDYNFTANVEKDFDAVADGEKNWTELIRHFYENFEPQVEKTLNQKTEHKVGERELGVDPVSGRVVSVKIGRFGPMVQMGVASDEEKPTFATLPPQFSLSSITLEEALELFKLPRTLGTFEDAPVVVNAGRFGPYVLHNKKYASLDKGEDPMSVTLERAVELILAKREAEAKSHLKSFEEEPDMEIKNGRYGPYLTKTGADGKSETRSLASEDEIFTVDIDKAKELFSQPKYGRGRGRGAAKPPLRDLGKDPNTGKNVTIKDGRFGAYITDGETNRTVPRQYTPESITPDDAFRLLAEKRARIDRVMARSAATMPSAALEQSVNWAKLYADWMLRTLPRGGCALCCELPENPALYGEGWAKAMEALLPLGGAARVQEMLRTLVDVSAQAQLAPGRVARSVSLSGRVLQAGGERESAQFVALVHHTLLWSGDRAFAADMLPMTGLCVNYLRRSTRGFEDVQEDMLAQVRAALVGHAYVLKLTGADDAATLALLDKLPAEPEQGEIAPNATLAERARWHGEHEHVEQVIVCMEQMAASAAPGLPGSVRTEDAAPGVLLQARAAEGMIRPAFECLFGVKPDAGRKAMAWRPHTPIGWEGWKLENLRIGDASFDLTSERVSPSRARYTIRTAQQGWTVCVTENGEEKALPLDGEISVILED